MTVIEELACMTAIGCKELETLQKVEKEDFTPILSASDRALMVMSALGAKKVEYYERIHPCMRKA